MSAVVKFLGPARALLRAREQECRLKRVDGVCPLTGSAYSVRLLFELVETRKRMTIEVDRAAWEEIRDRVDRAFVF
jgi:hypothetical protein